MVIMIIAAIWGFIGVAGSLAIVKNNLGYITILDLLFFIIVGSFGGIVTFAMVLIAYDGKFKPNAKDKK